MLYLVSDTSSYTNGECTVVDGADTLNEPKIDRESSFTIIGLLALFVT